MAEGNGAGRMDRIERTLEMLAEHQVKLEQNQEEFQRDLKQLLTSQVLQGDRLEKLATIVEENSRQIAEHSWQMAEQRARGDDIDTRMGKLVSAIDSSSRNRIS
jgi:predicted transcriptional regulator